MTNRLVNIAKLLVQEPVRWRSLLASVIVVVLVLAVIQEIRYTDPWPKCEYCERITACEAGAYGPVAQPMNSLSNLAYLFLAIVVWRNRRRFGAFWLTDASGLLCVGSTWFHAQPTLASHLGDLAGMFAVFVFLACYAVFTSHRLGNYWAATIIAMLISIGLIVTLNPRTSTADPVIIPTVIVVFFHVAYAAIKKIQSWKNAVLVIAAFAFAYLARQLDPVQGICDPNSLLQGHSIWHVLTAFGIVFAFLYFDEIRTRLQPAADLSKPPPSVMGIHRTKS